MGANALGKILVFSTKHGRVIKEFSLDDGVLPLNLLLIVNYLVVTCSDGKIRWISCSDNQVAHIQSLADEENTSEEIVGITVVPSYEFAIVSTESGKTYQ